MSNLSVNAPYIQRLKTLGFTVPFLKNQQNHHQRILALAKGIGTYTKSVLQKPNDPPS
ncbi:hypothetical protein [Geitlerinema sp. PCC 9228]|uniref:hypothetical protein n=1 Tax=Geitlerinema sp. PCC 9228 TaxID=111611 RepID=UPI00147C621F|nr:hypothetical protein [Geitlerinema sp. PCC 9228]